MKFYVICIIVLGSPAVFGLLTAGVIDTLYKYQDDCTKQAGLLPSVVESARKAYRIPENGSFDLFAACMLKKFNVMKDEYAINDDVRSYTIFTDNLRIYTLSEKCKTEGGKGGTENAAKIMNCFLKGGELLMPIRPRRN